MTRLHNLRRALLSAGGRSVIDSGSYNSSVHWILYSNGILKIYGTGKTIPPTKPWAEYISKIEGIVIDEGITTFSWNYSEGQFNGCANVRKITLPSTLTEINSNNTFANCTKLKEVVAPNGVPFNGIRYYTFLNCKSLETIQISITSLVINSSAFSGCTGLTSITIPDSVTSIGSYAFSGCTAITNIVVPNGVTSTMDSVFIGCTGATIIYGTGITQITNCPRTNDQTVICLGNITDCGSYMFQYVRNATIEFRNNTVVPTITTFGGPSTGTKKIIVPDALYDEWIAAPVWNTHPEWIIKASEV